VGPTGEWTRVMTGKERVWIVREDAMSLVFFLVLLG
jgi:hypothetical protein